MRPQPQPKSRIRWLLNASTAKEDRILLKQPGKRQGLTEQRVSVGAGPVPLDLRIGHSRQDTLTTTGYWLFGISSNKAPKSSRGSSRSGSRTGGDPGLWRASASAASTVGRAKLSRGASLRAILPPIGPNQEREWLCGLDCGSHGGTLQECQTDARRSTAAISSRHSCRPGTGNMCDSDAGRGQGDRLPDTRRGVRGAPQVALGRWNVRGGAGATPGKEEPRDNGKRAGHRTRYSSRR